MSARSAPSNKAAEAGPARRNQGGTAPVCRLLVVVDGHYPSTGGTEMQARLQSREFARAGHDVTVLVPRLDRRLPLRDEIDGVRVERIAYPAIPWLGAAILYLRFAALLWSRRRDYDAVHVHTAHFLAAVAGLVRPFSRATLVVKVGGAYEFKGGLLDPELRRRPLHRLANWMLRRADHLHCISDYTRGMLLSAGYRDARVRMIPNAVDLARFRPAIQQADVTRLDARQPDAVPTVAFVGRLVPVKGLADLLAAWQHVVAALPARLLIAGDGPLRHELEALALRLGISDSVTFCGSVEDVPAVLAKATVYVQPSHQEGMPNSVLEAMACGLPVVATCISGNVDLVSHDHNGLLVPVADSLALGAALQALLADPARARRMGAQARRFVEQQYSIPSVLERLLHAYRTPDLHHAVAGARLAPVKD